MRGLATVFILALILIGCSGKTETRDEYIYTLYANSPNVQATDEAQTEQNLNRVHIATFDTASSDENYNRSDCERVKKHYNRQWKKLAEESPESYSYFWCEQGRYKEINENTSTRQ